MIVGGRSLPSSSSTSKPPHSGICTSRNRTSGFDLLISSIASSPDPHSAIEAMSGSAQQYGQVAARQRFVVDHQCAYGSRLLLDGCHSCIPERQGHHDFYAAGVDLPQL